MTINTVSIGNNATLLICGTLIFNGSFNLSSNVSQVIVATGGSLHVTSSVIIDSRSTFPYPLPAKNGFIQVTVLDNNERIMIRRIVYYDIKGVNKLIVYPTIVESEISVWCKDEVVVLELYDSYARVIRKAAGCGSWDLSDPPSGIYVIIGHTKERTLDHVRILKR
jgi:hypothetical protein